MGDDWRETLMIWMLVITAVLIPVDMMLVTVWLWKLVMGS